MEWDQLNLQAWWWVVVKHGDNDGDFSHDVIEVICVEMIGYVWEWQFLV